jgi:hypothetical protein
MSPLSCVCDCVNCKNGDHAACYRGNEPLCPIWKHVYEEMFQREREALERPLLAEIDTLRLENRGLTKQKAEFFAEFERLRADRDDWMGRTERVEKELGEVKQLLAACRALRSIEHRIAGHNREDEDLRS